MFIEDVPLGVKLRDGGPGVMDEPSGLLAGRAWDTAGGEVELDRDGELGEVALADDPAELLLGFEHPGGRPAQRHLAVPVLDVAAGAADALDHRLARIRGLQRALQRSGDPRAGEGERFLQALAQRRGGAGCVRSSSRARTRSCPSAAGASRSGDHARGGGRARCDPCGGCTSEPAARRARCASPCAAPPNRPGRRARPARCPGPDRPSRSGAPWRLRRVLRRALPQPERDLDPVSADPQGDDVRPAPQVNPIEHEHRQPHVLQPVARSARPAPRACAQRNVRDTADSELERAARSSSSPTGSWVRP
jgi:hypothetical protein